MVIVFLKRTSGRKKSLAQMKECENTKRAITDLNAPNGSRDIPFQIQVLEPFCRFLASIPLKYNDTDAMLQDIKKMKVQYLMSLLFDLFEILQAVGSEQTNFAWL